MRSITAGSSMKLIRRMRPLPFGHMSGSTSYTFLINRAHCRRASFLKSDYHLFLRFQPKLRVPADNLLGLSERSVDHGKLPTGKPDSGSHRGWAEPISPDHRAGFGLLFAELSNGFH